MKLKKWGALLLALCMIVMMFPTTVMANGDSLAGPDAEKKVIENDLIVQLPSSLDDMIGTSAGNGDWLAVAAEPTWEDGVILDYVVPTQEFYDSTGKKLTAADTFQNNSRYTMKMTFQSFESYHGDYYYVLSGKNNVYVRYMNGTGEREPMKVTVNKDENGNPVIIATYSFSIGTPPEEPVNAYECSIYNMNTNELQTGETAKMDVVIGGTTQYRVQLFTTDPNGLEENVTTDSMRFDYTTVKDLSQYVDISVETEYNSYVVSLTGKQMLNDYSGCNFLFNNIEGNTLLGEADVTFNFIEPTDITLNKTYKLSDQTWQTLYYRYRPEPNGSQYYTLRTNNVRDCTPNDGHGKYSIYKSTDKNPIIFMLSRLTMDEECEFELVKYKLPTEIKILPIPDSIIEDIEKNGKEADLNGIKFTVTYDDGSTYTHELNGERMTISEGDNSFVQYEMDCWDLDKNKYCCIPDFEKNTITICSYTFLNTSDLNTSDEIELPERSKPHVKDSGKVTKAATTKSDGKITYSCSICKSTMETKPIYKISSVKLSNTAYTYNGKAKKPTVTVKDRTGKVISSKNYTVTYEKGRVNVGTYKVTVKFKGNYAGTVTKSFKINPKATGIVSATGKSKSAVVKWKKSTKQVTGYQIRYASKSNMANAKSVLVNKNTIVSKKISKLKAKKTYYIQVRTYKTVKGTKYYSAWSKVKKVKTKK